MKAVAIYTLTSELHDPQAVAAGTRSFLDSLSVDHDFRDADYSDYGQHVLDLIYVRTGGTEGIFRRLLPTLSAERPFRLLTSGTSNSLAASMEILSYLRQQGLKGEIIHGSMDYVRSRLAQLRSLYAAVQSLRGSRLGIIGQPSDWLISSTYDRALLAERLGIELLDIPMQELLDAIAATPLRASELPATSASVTRSLPGAEQIEEALRTLVSRYGLQGLTLRCFDLLSAVHNTGCLALARLNADGIVAGCEGDVPTMLTMRIMQALTGCTGFQANPSSIDPETGQMVFAHCTIPLNMVSRYELDTHFESGIGVAIRGYSEPGPVTVCKVAGDLSRHFVAEGQLLRCEAKPNLCRTQQVIQLADPSQIRYFLTTPIGNHHVIVPGHCGELLDELMTL